MRSTDLFIAFADGKYRFALKLPQAVELKRKTGRGPFELFDAARGAVSLDGELYYGGGATIEPNEIREIILQALIGGGECELNGEAKQVGSIEATALVNAYVWPSAPMLEGLHLARAILEAAIVGIQIPTTEADKKKAPSKVTRTRSTKAA